MTKNRRILMAAHPVGMIRETDFRFVEEAIPEPADGELVVRNHYLSLDPAIRGWMDPGDSYVAGIGVGDVMRAGGVGEVIASRHPGYPEGQIVMGMVGWEDYTLVTPDNPLLPLPGPEPDTAYLSVFGVTGLTAYFGLLDIGKPRAGETVVVSGAAGAVGSIAGQIAKILDCRVIGIAGGPAKCAWVTDELGFDACIDYKGDAVDTRLGELCPDGVDVYFDNVGGAILDAVLGRIGHHARLVLCGSISGYNATERPAGPANYGMLTVRSARMEGFILMDFLPRFFEGIEQLQTWVEAGRIRYAEDIVDGLVAAPTAINRLFTGENTGKLIVRV